MNNMLILDSDTVEGHQPPPVLKKHNLDTQYLSCTIWLDVWRCDCWTVEEVEDRCDGGGGTLLIYLVSVGARLSFSLSQKQKK